MVGKGRPRLFCGLDRRIADGAVAAEEENPDDAALANTGIALIMPLPCICHAQFANLGEETVSAVFSVVLIPCK